MEKACRKRKINDSKTGHDVRESSSIHLGSHITCIHPQIRGIKPDLVVKSRTCPNSSLRSAKLSASSITAFARKKLTPIVIRCRERDRQPALTSRGLLLQRAPLRRGERLADSRGH